MALKLLETLEKIGLTAEEGKVYLAALESGSRPASVLAKKANLKAGQTYNVLERLRSRGLIQELEKSGVKHFSAAPPNRLVSELERQTEKLQSIRERVMQMIPDLTLLYAPRLHHSKVRFYHGRNGVMQVVEDASRTPDKLILGILDAQAQDMAVEDEEVERFLADARAKRLKSDCWYYALVSGSEPLPLSLVTDYDRLRIVRKLPDITLPMQFLIHGQKLSIYTYQEPQFAVTIEDSQVADSARNMFFYVWNTQDDYFGAR